MFLSCSQIMWAHFRYCQLGKRLENDGVSVPPYADSQRKISSLDVETEHV